MISFCIFGVVVLLSVVELEAATSVSQISCPQRNLSVTVDNYLTLYLDGIEITNLPNSDSYNQPDTVDFPCTTRLIAIYGINAVAGGLGGIIASTDDDYVLTNSSWKCSNASELGWEGISFDDSAWKSALEEGYNGNSDWNFLAGLSTNAAWIWYSTGIGLDVYCRKKLVINSCDSKPCLNGGTCNNLDGDSFTCTCSIYATGVTCESLINSCDSKPCLNGGTCNNLDGDSFTCTCSIYATGVTCESPNYNEAYACGTTLTWSKNDAVNGFTRLCYFWTHVDDTAGRFTTCRNTINGLPLYGNYTGLLNAGGNFGCVVSQRFPDDISATSYLSCSDNFQQDVYLGNVSETDRLMVCIRYPYEGLPGRKQH